MSLTQIAREFRHSSTGVLYWLKKYSIPRRNRKLALPKGENHPNWKGGKTTKTCEHCGKKFKDYLSANRKFCSQKCFYESRIPKREVLVRKYLEEGKSIATIAKEFNRVSAYHWFEKHSIPKRDTGFSKSLTTTIDTSKWMFCDDIWKPKMSPSLCYFLGVMLGDGTCIVYSTGKGQGKGTVSYVKLAAMDFEFVKSFERTLKEIGLKKSYFWIDKKRPLKNKNWHVIYNCFGYSLVLARWFKGLSLDDIKNIVSKNDNFKIQFIRGFYESEGGTQNNNGFRAVRFDNANLELLSFVRHLLVELGFHLGKITRGHDDFRFGIFRDKEAARFIELINPCIKREFKGVYKNESVVDSSDSPTSRN